MGSTTPLLDILLAHVPSTALPDAISPHSGPAVETLLCFALGADCPTRLPAARQDWSRIQPVALRALHDTLGSKLGVKRARDSQDMDDATSKRQRTVQDDTDDPPLFTLPSVSATSPVRRKVDVTIHARSIRFVNPSTRAVESSVPLASIARTFLLPTRGKTKGHWTVVLLPSDVPDKAKSSPSSPQQVIFGLDARSPVPFKTTSYSSGTPTPDSTTAVAKGEETATSIRQFLSHIPVPLLEPSATVFRSACATAKSGEGAAGIDAYLSAKAGTLWFFDAGILWGESKPCEFWAVSDLAPKDGIRLISATGRTCSVIFSRKGGSAETSGGDRADGQEVAPEELIETEFSMVDGREQDPINAWTRNRKHLFGKTSVVFSVSGAAASQTARSGTIKGPAWDDSDSDDEDFEVPSSEDLEHSASDTEESEGGSVSGDENNGRSEGAEESGEEEEEEEEEEELQEAHHPLLRPGAMPRMSKAAVDAVIDLVHDDLMIDASEEEDELEE